MGDKKKTKEQILRSWYLFLTRKAKSEQSSKVCVCVFAHTHSSFKANICPERWPLLMCVWCLNNNDNIVLHFCSMKINILNQYLSWVCLFGGGCSPSSFPLNSFLLPPGPSGNICLVSHFNLKRDKWEQFMWGFPHGVDKMSLHLCL